MIYLMKIYVYEKYDPLLYIKGVFAKKLKLIMLWDIPLILLIDLIEHFQIGSLKHHLLQMIYSNDNRTTAY